MKYLVDLSHTKQAAKNPPSWPNSKSPSPTIYDHQRLTTCSHLRK